MKLRIYKQNFTTLYITITIIIFAVIRTFSDSIWVQYSDEAFAVFSLLCIIWKYPLIHKNSNANKLFKVTLVTLVVLVIVGLISNIVSKVILKPIPIVIDLFGMIKLPLAFLYVYAIVSDKEKKIILNNLKLLAKIFIIIAFLCGIANLFTNIGMSYDIRYGIRSYTFIYKNPAALNEVLIISYAIISVTSSRKANRFFGFMAILSIIFTFRGIGIGVAGLIIMFKIYFYYKDANKPLRPYKLIPFAFVAILLGINQIKEYFITGTSLRALLLKNSIVVFKRFFPLGSGFATYGSDQAYKNYSRLYYEFGYNNIYMLSPEHGYVANDNFWPMIIAQFGAIGFVCYLYLVYCQFKIILNLKANREIKVASISLLALVFIASLGNAIYTSASGMMIYIILGCIIKTE